MRNAWNGVFGIGDDIHVGQNACNREGKTEYTQFEELMSILFLSGLLEPDFAVYRVARFPSAPG